MKARFRKSLSATTAACSGLVRSCDTGKVPQPCSTRVLQELVGSHMLLREQEQLCFGGALCRVPQCTGGRTAVPGPGESPGWLTLRGAAQHFTVVLLLACLAGELSLSAQPGLLVQCLQPIRGAHGPVYGLRRKPQRARCRHPRPDVSAGW